MNEHFAEVYWSIDDFKKALEDTINPPPESLDALAQGFMDSINEARLIEVMIERGWDYIYSQVPYEKILQNENTLTL